MKLHAAKRMHNVKLHVDGEERPGWPSGRDREPLVGEEVFCTMGKGTVVAVQGRTGDGTRLLQISLDLPGSPPFFAAASNVLVHPMTGAEREAAAPRPETGIDSVSGGTEGWLG
jgi:hypothetical protein